MSSSPQPTGSAFSRPEDRLRCSWSTHCRDKDSAFSDPATAAVNQLDRLAGIVDEHALAGGMALSHRRRQATLPGPVQLAPTAVTVTTRLGGLILFL